MPDYSLLDIKRDGQIATIELKRIEKHLRQKHADGKRGGAQRAAEVGRALNELRDDNAVRVIVVTGKDDVFTIPPSSYGHHGDPGNDWDIMSGVTRAVEAMCTIEKPVIAKVNGHAVGFGANLVALPLLAHVMTLRFAVPMLLVLDLFSASALGVKNRLLIDKGELRPGEASWPAIRDWARRNPARVPELLAANPRVVFFREEALPDAQLGPRGAQGVALTPERSAAVDPKSVPYGSPLWLDTTEPLTATPLRRLVLAQDTGSAITGAVRADYFWGWGERAEQQAGRMKQPLKMWVLWPK